MDWHAIVGIVAGLVQVVSIVPYVHSMLRGTTRPSAISQFLWTLLGVIAIAAQISAGASWSLGILIAVTFNTALLTVLAFVGYGYKKYYWHDWLCLLFAIAAIVIWQLTKNPVNALVIAVTANLFSAIPTWVKTFRDPLSELPFAWFLVAIASVLGIISTTIWDVANLVFPVYFLFESMLVLVLASVGRIQKRTP